MLFFYVLDLLINAAILGAFVYRYKQTGVKYYKWLAGACGAIVVSSALIAFLADSLAFPGITVFVIYGAMIIVSLAGLVFLYTILFMFQDWVHSMRNAPTPAAHKLDKARQIIDILKKVYPGITLTMIVVYVLLMVSLGFAGILVLLVGLVSSVAIVAQLAVMIWMWLDVKDATDAAQIQKRNQLIRVAAMTFFSAWPALLGGVGAGLGGSVCYWIWYGIALWPNALVGYEQQPQSDLPHVPMGYPSAPKPAYMNKV